MRTDTERSSFDLEEDRKLYQAPQNAHSSSRREGIRGSFDDFLDEEHVHLVHQESTLFAEELVPSEATRQDSQVSEESNGNFTVSLQLSAVLEPGTCDFWGDELVRQASAQAVTTEGKKSHVGHKPRNPRHRMLADQRAQSEIETMLGGEDARPAREKGPKRSSNLAQNSGVLHEQADGKGGGSTMSQRLFVVDIPAFRFGLTGSGVNTPFEEIAAHLLILTLPLYLSPIVVAFFEECMTDVHTALSEHEASVAAATTSATSGTSSKKASASWGSSSRFSRGTNDNSKTGMMSGLATNRVVFTMRMSPSELNVKSSQDQPMSSLKLVLDNGLDWAWSWGGVFWDKEERLGSIVITIPMVSLVVHELNPVIAAKIKNIKLALHDLHGALPGMPIYTCVNQIDLIDISFNFWRVEAFFGLLQEWQAAWSQLLEERRARKEHFDQMKLTRQKSAEASQTDAHRHRVPIDTMRTSFEKFDRVLQSRGRRGPDSASGSDESVGRQYWEPTLFLCAATRIKTVKLSSQLGVLASTFDCEVSDVASRLSLPGQLRSVDREQEADTFYIVLGKATASVTGFYEGALSLTPQDEPGCCLYIAREKPATRMTNTDWQPWNDRRTTLNRVFARFPDLHASLARVITGEKAKTRTHLFRTNSSFIGIQLRDVPDAQDPAVVTLDAAIECHSFASQISVDAPPILVEAIEQLSEQIAMARRSLEAKYAQTEDPKLLGSFSLASQRHPRMPPMASVMTDMDRPTLRAFQAVGSIKVRFDAFDVIVVHDPTSAAWGASAQLVGMRLLTTKLAKGPDTIERILTMQTAGIEVFRYHGHNWKALPGPTPSARRAPQSGSGANPPASSESQESEDEQQSDGRTSASVTPAGPSTPVSHEYAAARNSANRRAFLSKRGNKNIVSFPKSSLAMHTTQQLTASAKILESTTEQQLIPEKTTVRIYRLQSTVEYQFTSTFRDAISVSTDGREYAKLREIIGQLRFSTSQGGGPAATEDGTVAAIDRRQFQPSDSERSFVFEPQLNIMGEATTAVLDWFFDENIQLKKNELPKQIHITVVDSLEQLLAAISTINSGIDDAFISVSESKGRTSTKDRR